MDNIAIIAVIADLKAKLTAHAAVYEYNLANLCIKTHPYQLIHLTVAYAGQPVNLEEVCYPIQEDEKHFDFVVPDKRAIEGITFNVIKMYPLLKLDVIMEKEEGDANHIMVWMPEMTKERRDAMHQAVKLRYEQIKTVSNMEYANANADLMSATKVSIVEKAQCAGEFKKLKDESDALLKEMRDDMQKYIDEAYEQHEAEKKNMEDFAKSVRDKEVGQKMKIDGLNMPKAPSMPNTTEMPQTPK